MKYGSDTAAKLLKYKTDMLEYLNDKSCGHYKKQAATLGRRLTIDFVDLMWKSKDLAESICNDRGSSTFWLQQAAEASFEENNLPSDNVTFDFKDMPSHLLQAKKFMKTLDCVQIRSICGGIATVVEATPHGRRGADVILSGILDFVQKGVSWCGQLSSEDLWFGQGDDGILKLYIAKQPVYTAHAPKKDRVLDVQSIWAAIKGALALEDGKLPLYFAELRNDLKNTIHLPDWFFTYLRFHPAMYASMPRRNLILAVNKPVKRFQVASQKKFNRVFTVRPVAGADWRGRAGSGALNEVLKYRTFQKNKPDKKQTGGCNITGTSDATKNSGSLGNSGSPTSENAIVYVDTANSLLIYVRNGLEHLDQYLKVEDDDEIELYLALMFPEILPHVIKGLLSECNMGGCFNSAWETYKKAK